MANPLLAFAAGFGGGYLNQTRQNKLDDERTADRDMRKQEFDVRMDEVNRTNKDRISLANAARPAVVNEGAATLDLGNGPKVYDDAGVAGSDMRQARTMGLADVQAPQQAIAVNGKQYADRATADAAVADYNKPEARTMRLSAAYSGAGRPDKALDVEANQAKVTREQADYAKKLKDEGVFNALRSFRAGDTGGLVKAFNSDGQYKLDGTPEITREDREVPGVGTVPTYNAKLRMVGPDGQMVEKSYNSHDLSMQMMPYEKALELQRKGTESDSKNTNREGLLTLKAKTAAAAAKAASGGGAPSREERMRYTSLFSEAGRRAGEAQKALTALQKDPMYSRAQPGTPRAQELQDLRETIKAHNEERSTYQSMLAGSQSKTPALADARNPGAAPAAAPKDATGREDFSKLWK
jgi:hypothetical protein